MMIRVLLLLALTTVLSGTLQADSLKLLFLGDQGHHQPALRFEIIEPVLKEQGIDLIYTENLEDLNPKTLSQFDGLVVYANIDTISPDQARSLLDYVHSGHGFIPLHCATYCFRNNPDVVALMGAQFQRHGTGEMTTESAGTDHSVVDGYKTFNSWDETYVHHKHNADQRVVLEYRTGEPQADGKKREPWTWVRSSGDGRVFYTAWGHDERTWTQPGFQDLLIRGIRWACGEGDLGIDTTPAAGELAEQKELPADLPEFEYVDVGPEIPNYAAGNGETLNLMQKPMPAESSMQHAVTPEGMHVELFADESMLGGKIFGGKPIAMTWDERGRLWICETVDYPNELNEQGGGRDRVRIIEDTDGDMVADRSTVFAEDLSIPTAIAFHRGGVVVQNGTETLFLKDTDGDGHADVRKVLISNWRLADTHGGVSNFRNGLDNWIWAMQGYNGSQPVINGVQQPGFSMGFFRFKLSQDDDPIVEKLEFVRSTTNNTWGLGISEEGLIFGSTANRAPSFFMPIANRYYERVNGWAPERLSMICPDHLFNPITDNIRQVDHHGGYTAAAGHALYTGRNYPQAWWNRTAFVCGPTGKLVGTFVIEPDGAGMKSHSPVNLLASDDEWTAPIMAEVGPDGNVWVLDWYNYIVQHNPTPQGFETGKGAAYETKLRDKKFGRIYRVVPDGPANDATRSASISAPTSLAPTLESVVSGLSDPTMVVRLHAQRLLIERGKMDVVPQLIRLVNDPSVDAIGMNPPAIHALQTLHGLGAIRRDNAPVYQSVVNALMHPSAGVRLNAIRVLPETADAIGAINASATINDDNAQVVLATLLKLSDISGEDAGNQLSQAISNPRITSDPWLSDALTSAAAMHVDEFLTSLLAEDQPVASNALVPISRIAEHLARSKPSAERMQTIVSAMADSPGNINESIIAGLASGWPKDHVIELKADSDKIVKIFTVSSNTGKASLLRLASSWSSEALESQIGPMLDDLIQRMGDQDRTVQERLETTDELVSLAASRTETADEIEKMISPLSPVSLSVGLLSALSRTKVDNLGERFLSINETATPEIRDALIRVMLSRPELTTALVDALKAGDLQVNDLTIEQRGLLSENPDKQIRQAIEKIFKQGGVVVNNDRSKLIDSKMGLTQTMGNPENGKAVFVKNCSACHLFKGEGQIVGPNLNGMSVHPKAELLTHILDPNRSVEANYRLYTVLTVDGVVISGLLSGESLTAIDVVDTQGKRHTILREDIEELLPSKKSAMPEGFEQSIDDKNFTDLLEYLTQPEAFLPLGIEAVANIKTNEGMFTNRDNGRERLRLAKYGNVSVDEIPFSLIDPAQRRNAFMLYGPNGKFGPQMPRSVDVRCGAAAKTIYILGGVGGWSATEASDRGVSLIVRLQYADGVVEDHPLIDGQHIADYIRLIEVPQSKLAFKALDGGQVRMITIKPKRESEIQVIRFVKPEHHSTPVVMAVTIEPIASKEPIASNSK